MKLSRFQRGASVTTVVLGTALASSVGCSSEPPAADVQVEEPLASSASEEEGIDTASDDDDALDDGQDDAADAADDEMPAENMVLANGGAADAQGDEDGLASAEDQAEEADEAIDGLAGAEDDPAFPEVSAQLAAQIPSKIKYVMVLVKENHTFDNYFTGFPGATWSKKARLHSGRVITRPFAPDGKIGTPCHSNNCGETALDDGKMNGFGRTGTGMVPFARYRERQIPNYWSYAREFVLADHFFSTTLGPSSPGHEVFWFGRSTTLDNPKCHDPKGCTGTGCTADSNVKATAFNPLSCTTKEVAPCFNLPSLPDHLPRGFSWVDYGGPMAMQIKSVAADPNHKVHFRKAGNLVKDLENGKLANLTIAHLSGGDTSEHPPHSPCKGENLTVDIVNAAMKLPQWKEMAIIVTWDDWGGFYDHVKPPTHKCKNGKIMENGFRLPLLLISPYAKKGFVLKHHTEQASVPRLVEELWGMSFMTTRSKYARDGIAGSLLPAFDFQQTPRAPVILKKRASCPF